MKTTRILPALCLAVSLMLVPQASQSRSFTDETLGKALTGLQASENCLTCVVIMQIPEKTFKTVLGTLQSPENCLSCLVVMHISHAIQTVTRNVLE